MNMKKIVMFVVVLFMFSCGPGNGRSRTIEQRITFDNVANNYSITTSFGYPETYSACVYCAETKIDSFRKVEYNKAISVQSEMIKKMY
jgi:hypothetical protein